MSPVVPVLTAALAVLLGLYVLCLARPRRIDRNERGSGRERRRWPRTKVGRRAFDPTDQEGA